VAATLRQLGNEFVAEALKLGADPEYVQDLRAAGIGRGTLIGDRWDLAPSRPTGSRGDQG